MGSTEDDTAPVTINSPFSIRDYVFATRQKDISCNWPFSEKHLQACIKHGITKMLPPFESHNFGKNQSCSTEVHFGCAKEDKANVGSIHKNFVEFDREEEIIIVYNDVSTSNTNLCFDYHMDQCLTAVPSSKRLKFKRKRNGKLKKRSMADIIAKARPCTLEELDKINESNWAIDQRVVYRGATTSEKVQYKVNGRTNPAEDDRGAKLAERIWNTKHPRDDDKDENTIVVGKEGQRLKIKLNGRKPKAQNIIFSPSITNESKMRSLVAKARGKGSLTNETEYQSIFQDLGSENPETSAHLPPDSGIEAKKESGQSEKIKLKTIDTKCLKGLFKNSFAHPSAISDRKLRGIINKEPPISRLKGLSNNSFTQRPSATSDKDNSRKSRSKRGYESKEQPVSIL